MISNTLRISLLLAILTAGCGSDGAPVVIVAEIQEISPQDFDLESPKEFTIKGRAFSSVGEPATVLFIAKSGTPFFPDDEGNGTSDRVRVSAIIRSSKELVGSLALPGVADPVSVTVEVTFPDGTKSTLDATIDVMLRDSSLAPANVVGPAVYIDVNRDGSVGPNDVVVLRFDREVRVPASMADPKYPTVPTSIAIDPAGPNSFGTNPVILGPEAIPPAIREQMEVDKNVVAVVLGDNPRIKARQTYVAGAMGDNDPAGIFIMADSGITNRAPNGTIAEHETAELPNVLAKLDISPGFMPGLPLAYPEAAPKPPFVFAGNSRGVVVAEISGGGRPDVIVVDGLGDHRFYEVSGTGTLLRPVRIATFRKVTRTNPSNNQPEEVEEDWTSDFARAIAAGDLNEDGLVDLVVARIGGPNHVFIQRSARRFELVAQLGAANTVAVALGDIDCDGDLDIVTGNEGGGGRVYLNKWKLEQRVNDTDPAFPDSGLRLNPTIGNTEVNVDNRKIILRDFDCDGDLDLLFGNIGRDTLWWNRSTNDSLTDETIDFVDSRLVSGSDATNDVAVGDVDGDGDLDYVAANFVETKTVAPSDTQVTFIAPNMIRHGDQWDWVPKPGDSLKVSGILKDANRSTFTVASVTGRNLITVVEQTIENEDAGATVTILSRAPLVRVWLREPNGFVEGGGFGERFGEGVGDSRAIALHDFDQDGDLDAVIGTAFAGTTIWLNDGNGTFRWNGQRLPSDRLRGLALSDFDRDGDMDVVVTNSRSAEQVWFNSLAGTWGGAGLPDASPPAGIADWTADVAVGHGLIATGDASSRSELWTDTDPPTFVRRLAPFVVRSLAIGNFDGGDGDVVTCHEDGVDVQWDDGTATSFVDAQDCWAVAVADCDGANGDDIVVARDGRVDLLLSDGSAQFTTVALSQPGVFYRSVIATDLNGDDRVDIAAGHATGFDVWLNDGTPFQSTPALRQAVPGGAWAIAAGDIRGLVYGGNVATNSPEVSFESPDTIKINGSWVTTPAEGDTIIVRGGANPGAYTVDSLTGNNEIAVTQQSISDAAKGAPITIAIEGGTNEPVVDLVTAGNAVRWWKNLSITVPQPVVYVSETAPESAAATDVIAGRNAIIAAAPSGHIYWATDASSITETIPESNPWTDALAWSGGIGTVYMRPGAGHARNSAVFGNSRDTVLETSLFIDADADGEGALERVVLVTDANGSNRIWRIEAGALVDSGETVGHGFAAVCDVNDDGYPDVVTADEDYRGARIWLGDAAGTFTQGDELHPEDAIRGALFANVTPRACQELVLLGGRGVYVMGGAGYTTDLGGNMPAALDVAVLDWIPGGPQELALAMGNSVQVWSADGASALDVEPPSSTLRTPGRARVVVAGDFDRDGRDDFAFCGRATAVRVAGHGGEVNGGLVHGLWAESLAKGDFDGDGILDLVFGGFGRSNGILLDPSRNPGPAPSNGFGGVYTVALAVVDIDRDGDLDVITRDRESDTPAVHRNR